MAKSSGNCDKNFNGVAPIFEQQKIFGEVKREHVSDCRGDSSTYVV